MLQRKTNKEPVTSVYGYLVSVEIEDGVTSPEAVTAKLADSVTWVEGVGDVTVDLLGRIDVVGDGEPGAIL